MKTKIRLMTSNLWWGEATLNPVEIREDQLAAVYARYSPDVIGLQEATVAWWDSKLFAALEKTYTMVDVDETVKAWFATMPESEEMLTGRPECRQQNFVPLFYKTEQYDCLEKGWMHFANTPDPTKCFCWAVLKDKASGAVFGAVATHFWWKNGPEHEAIRVQNVQEMTACMKAIAEQYNAPVFAMGDMNCRIASEAFGALLASGCRDLQQEAKCTSVLASHHGNPVRGEDGVCRGTMSDKGFEDSIDHILMLGGANVQVEAYQVVTDQDALDASDHSPVYADVILE